MLVCRGMLVKAVEQPATVQEQDPDRATPPGVVVVPILPQQPHTDTTALFQSGGLIRNKAALTGIGDSCGCMEYGYTRYILAVNLTFVFVTLMGFRRHTIGPKGAKYNCKGKVDMNMR